jgi:hypothetical protein
MRIFRGLLGSAEVPVPLAALGTDPGRAHRELKDLLPHLDDDQLRFVWEQYISYLAALQVQCNTTTRPAWELEAHKAAVKASELELRLARTGRDIPAVITPQGAA